MRLEIYICLLKLYLLTMVMYCELESKDITELKEKLKELPSKIESIQNQYQYENLQEDFKVKGQKKVEERSKVINQEQTIAEEENALAETKMKNTEEQEMAKEEHNEHKQAAKDMINELKKE